MRSCASGKSRSNIAPRLASDVVIDVIGYRRHGHSEVDDPTITQPLLYAKIKDHPQLWQIYAKEIGADPSATVTAVRNELEAAHQAASEMQKKPRLRRLPAYWSPYKRGRYDSAYEVDTGVAPAELGEDCGFTDQLSGGFCDSSESEEAARAARRNGAWQAPRGLRNGGSARVRNAVAGGNTGAVYGTGHAARDVQPEARGARRYAE